MYDVIVIGAGHAGVEAAAAAARRGACVALISFRRDDIGQMSCNPSIGGVGKGHLVREIDALGGVMAAAADRAAIHRRMLNASKGRAVHGPRVQADRELFKAAVSAMVIEAGVEVLEAEVTELLIEREWVVGVALRDGTTLQSRSVVLATGTFLGATLFRGSERWAGGRLGGAASTPLAQQIRELGLAAGKLKTGTPPRIDGRTIDWAKTATQPSDSKAWSMSIDEPGVEVPQLACGITRTVDATHGEIRGGLGESPLFSGAIEGRGPRYCPSIEDKILRFGDRDGHQIFLEPEGLSNSLVYPNGLSTSLSKEAQAKFVRTIPGLERAAIVEFGYAVEYEFGDPRRLRSTLEHREVGGLFFAGQINGTTGYEEAGAQGLVAGCNAAAIALEQPQGQLDRSQSYIGVMLDDLTLQGVSEPYRMMTARSEYRLHLRADNAYSRLYETARSLSLLAPNRRRAIERRLSDKDLAATTLRSELTGHELGLVGETSRKPLAEWARRADALPFVEAALDGTEGAKEALDDAVYAPYLERQSKDVATREQDRGVKFPDHFDLQSVPGLSNEMREKIAAARPESLDQASRVPGITPAALAALHFALSRLAA